MIFITLVYRWCVSIIGKKKSSERFDLHSGHSKDNFINYFYIINLGICLFPEHIYSLLHSTLNTQSCVYKGVIWNCVPHRGYKIRLSSLADETGEQTNNYDTIFYLLFCCFIVVVFAIHWHESAMDIHVFPIPIPPPTSLSTRSLWVFPVHQVWALVSCIQPGLVICFTIDNIHVSMLFSWNISPHLLPQSPKVCSVHLCLFFCFAYRVIITIFLNSVCMCVSIL